ncbi:MAG: hypothetical protein V1494_05365 [Candidatus Diapherotrites archaeon]
MVEAKTVGWIIALIFIVVFVYFLAFGIKFVDCEDGGGLTLNPQDCLKVWCSSLNKRVNINAGELCTSSMCPDGVTKTMNLTDCPKYHCNNGLEVDSPNKCAKFTCMDGNAVEDLNQCKEYCAQTTDCTPEKARVTSCFGKMACESSKCVWKCESAFTSAKIDEIALSLEELVGEHFSEQDAKKIIETTDFNQLTGSFDNKRDKISFFQLVRVLNKGQDKTQFANSFNSMVNQSIESGNEAFGSFNLGEDSFATKISSEKIAQSMPFPAEIKPNLVYGGAYALLFRKSNVIVVLLVIAENNESATNFFNNYATMIESRIS